jgi:hypothetical protein
MMTPAQGDKKLTLSEKRKHMVGDLRIIGWWAGCSPLDLISTCSTE